MPSKKNDLINSKVVMTYNKQMLDFYLKQS